MSDADTFLRALWETKPSGTAIQLWRKSDHKTFTFQSLDPARNWVEGNGDCDIYMAAGLASKSGPPRRQRATKRDVIGIPGIWADIDVNGGPEGKTGAAPDVTSGLALAESLYAPTVIVNSGYGIQAWWLFDSVWGFHTEDEREHAQRVVVGFQGALRVEAKKRGFTIDSTHDLARLMRVPGSFNCKGGLSALVELLDDGGNRYTLAQLEEVGADYQQLGSSALRMFTGEAIEIEVDPSASPPLAKLDGLRDIDLDFDGVWNHKPSNKTKSWSMSEYEFSLVNYFVSAGWNDQEICNALVYHRLRFEPTDPKGKNRVDRLAQTIGKVRATADHERTSAIAEADREEAVDQLAAISSESGLDPIVTLGLFNRVLGGPEVKEFIQHGRDSETTRYVMVLASGDEIHVGSVENLLSQERFRAKFLTPTKHVMKAVKPAKWLEIVQALVSAAQVREGIEDTKGYRGMEWVKEYTESLVSTDKNLACELYDPYLQDDHLFVPLAPFHQYLRRRGERLAEPDLAQYLQSAGFERRTVNYQRSDGRRSTRSYFVGRKAE